MFSAVFVFMEEDVERNVGVGAVNPIEEEKRLLSTTADKARLEENFMMMYC